MGSVCGLGDGYPKKSRHRASNLIGIKFHPFDFPRRNHIHRNGFHIGLQLAFKSNVGESSGKISKAVHCF